MKILIGMPSPGSWGGTIACEPPVAEALAASGEDVTSEIYIYGDKAERYASTSRRVRRVVTTALRLRRLLKGQSYDVVHLNSAFDRRSVLRDAATILLIGRTRAKYFLKVHGASPEEFAGRSLVYGRLISFLNTRVSGFGVHTEEEMAGLEQIGLDRKKFFVTHNAIVVNREKPEGFVRNHKEPHERFRLLYAARFIGSKGVLETIRACAILREKGFDIELECLGDGPLEQEAHQLADNLGLSESVNFRGHVPANELDRLFFETDVFVFPTSHNEGFPIGLFNAVAAGMPIVTTKTRAANDNLSDPDNCLFSTDQPEDIAKRLAELIQNKELRTMMSEANVRFGEQLSPERMAVEYLAIYKKVAGV